MRLTFLFAGVSAAWLLVGGSADAQTIGTFKWQQQPYCNVLTLTIIQDAASYRLEGSDDQCGTPRLASALGLAFVNPNGTIGMGLTVITNNGGGTGGVPLHLDVVIDVATASGTWRDSTGQTGRWTLIPGAGLGGSARPAPVLAPGIVTTGALAPGSVTTDKLAASAFSGTGSATTVARSDHDHDTRYYTKAQTDNRVFGSILAMGIGLASGGVQLLAPGSNVTATRNGTGSYTLTVPGLDPGCVGNRFIFSIVSSATVGAIATAGAGSGSSISCATGNSSASVTIRNTAGTLIDGDFTFIVYKSAP
jgi:hypothetical protein